MIPGKGRRFFSSLKRPDRLWVPGTFSPPVTRARSEFVSSLKIRYDIPPLPHTSLTLRRLMSYIYGAPILDVSRSHTTTQHSR